MYQLLHSSQIAEFLLLMHILFEVFLHLIFNYNLYYIYNIDNNYSYICKKYCADITQEDQGITFSTKKIC